MENIKKRVAKSEIKFKSQLTEEQKEIKDQILKNKISVIYGKAGSSKTFLACNTALDFYFKRKINRITIVRPTVATENIGYLPGDVFEKMYYWFIPIINNFYNIYEKEKIDSMLKEEAIRMLPLQFTQGITFKDEIVILDEAQNCTDVQLYMMLTRIGENTKIIITGDLKQIQLRDKNHSGFNRLLNLKEKIDGLFICELRSNHRDPIVEKITEMF